MKGYHFWLLAIFALLTVLSTISAALVPDTGQTLCYDDQGHNIVCPLPGEAFYGQDGCYRINPQSYTKLGQQMNPLADNAANWLMVRDNVTGRVWQVKTNEGGFTNNSFRVGWYYPYAADMNSAKFGGFSDWRAPDVHELSGILNFGTHSPATDTRYFPHAATPNMNYYWSSTQHASYINIAWPIYFKEGIISSYEKSYFHHFRGVREGCYPTTNSFFQNADGTVSDVSTGLMWCPISGGPMNWKSALAYAETLTFPNEPGGYKDWRLPTINELRSITDYRHATPAIDRDFFKDAHSAYYWSATTHAVNTANAWTVYLQFGSSSNSPKSMDRYVYAVRGGDACQKSIAFDDQFRFWLPCMFLQNTFFAIAFKYSGSGLIWSADVDSIGPADLTAGYCVCIDPALGFRVPCMAIGDQRFAVTFRYTGKDVMWEADMRTYSPW